MWFVKCLMIGCVFGVVFTLELCERMIEKENLSLMMKIELFLSKIRQSRKLANKCDNKYVSESLVKTYDINFNVPHLIQTLNETVYSDEVLNISGEATITFYPERVFMRKKHFSTSLQTVKSNFQDGHLNGKFSLSWEVL